MKPVMSNEQLQAVIQSFSIPPVEIHTSETNNALERPVENHDEDQIAAISIASSLPTIVHQAVSYKNLCISFRDNLIAKK